MGHALVAASLPDIDPVLKISIIPRGIGALGYTMQRPTEDRFVLAESELRHRISVLMGGRAAETLIFDGDVSTGASDDLQRATHIAQEMVTRYGMTPTVGQRIYANVPPSFLSASAEERPNASESTMREIDLAVRDIVAQAFDEAQTIVKERRSDLDRGAELLLTKEVLAADEFPAIRRSDDSVGSEKKVA
jgi:cell division protease FtsH